MNVLAMNGVGGVLCTGVLFTDALAFNCNTGFMDDLVVRGAVL